MARRRRRGEGSVFYDHAGKRWVGTVSIIRGGKRFRPKVTAPTERQALARLEDLRRQYQRGPELGRMTVAEHMADWLTAVQHTVKPATFVSYSGHVRMHIDPVIGEVPLVRLAARDVRHLIADRRTAGLKPGTIRRIITTLQMALGQAVREGLIPTNIANGIRLPRQEPYPIRAMTWEDADRIIEAVRGDRFEALYVLLLYSGMRLGEAVALDWADVDLDTKTVYVRKGKTKASARIVPLADVAADALRAHRAGTARVGMREPVFLSERRKERVRGDVITHQFPRLLEAKGLPRMRVHDLRHGTATLLLANKVPARDIADLLGHSSPSVTMNVYMHVTEAMQREAVNSLNFRGRRPIGSRQGSQSG